MGDQRYTNKISVPRTLSSRSYVERQRQSSLSLATVERETELSLYSRERERERGHSLRYGLRDDGVAQHVCVVFPNFQ
jgi:hypothetical protein